ncbi:pyrroline-5-carboxylate reductase [Pseudomaricurvus alkylphenolicus]|uniref:pyrroline-5-carboxylate reductase n=1 Tax=Pseudomaricurvus alkylphenolicus TaxID=1306991 RepID=UPI0014202252|nr:pyrroline-5-carboxylate reductase [Pseudomaricurvus alkylphenolicus]
MSDVNLTFIGAGNMASSIIGGLVKRGFAADSITATDPYPPSLEKLADTFPVQTNTDNAAAAVSADIIVLAVKPQVMQQVCEDLQPHLNHKPMVISIAAGIDIRSLDQWLGNDLAIVRCMPNTPALVQTGASGLFANAQTNDEQRRLAEEILKAVGIVEWLETETQLDPVTAVSGSGPAYFFLLMEAMIEAGVAQGLERDTATALTLQTALGAARLAQDSDVDVAELRRRVTSPNGTTEQAILSFENDNLRTVVATAMEKCAQRSVEMATELGAQ